MRHHFLRKGKLRRRQVLRKKACGYDIHCYGKMRGSKIPPKSDTAKLMWSLRLRKGRQPRSRKDNGRPCL
jgi:hypothetical protein